VRVPLAISTLEPGARPERDAAGELRGYGLAAATVIATLGLKAVIPLLGDAHPFVLLPIAVVIPAWYAGIGPAIGATLLCVIGVDYLFLPPADFGVDTDATGLLALLAEGLAISWLTSSLRDARQSAQRLAIDADRARREAALALAMREEILSLWTVRLRGPLSDFTTAVEAARIAHRDGDRTQTALALEQLQSSAEVMRRSVDHWDERSTDPTPRSA